MMKQVLTTALISLGIGYLCQVVQTVGQTQYLNEFLKANLISLLIALLAINSATMGIVLTKIRDLIDKKGAGSESFTATKSEMLLSIKEQIGLIALSVIILTFSESVFISSGTDLKSAMSVALCAIFAYSMLNLYDMAKSVIIIIDYD